MKMLLFSVLPLALAAGSFPRVRIFNPKEGDIWFSGEVRTIVWRKAYIPPPPYPPTLNITLTRQNDSSFRVPLVVNYDTSRGAFQWRIPSWLPTCDHYVLRIIPNRAFPRPGRPNIMASKSKPFTIIGKNVETAIRVLTPSAGTIWYSGQFRVIRWRLDGSAVGASVSLMIEETKNGYVGRSYPYVIATDLKVGADGLSAYNWQVPYSFRSSDSYVISLIASFTDGRAPVVGKTALFSISQAGDASSGTPIVILPHPAPTPYPA